MLVHVIVALNCYGFSLYVFSCRRPSFSQLQFFNAIQHPATRVEHGLRLTVEMPEDFNIVLSTISDYL
jgi:hypothetical protein